MRRLDVYLGEGLAGALTELPGSPVALEFCYDRAWLQWPQRVALSLSMPLRAEPYPHEVAAPYFANILPEGDPRDVIGQRLGIAPNDIYAMLEALGRDCAGALVILPHGSAPPPPLPKPGSPPYLAMPRGQVGRLIDGLPQRPLGIDPDDGGARLSLAGVQDKLVLSRVGAGWVLPDEGLPSTHIIKPANPRLPGSVENEALCLDLAARTGLDTARATIDSIDGRRCLVVTRYDRSFVDGGPRRIHQEDFCQALSRWPNQKYENRGGPGLVDCFRILESVSAPAVDRLKLLDAVAFNVLVGNVDAHAKNFSILHLPGGTVRLAPLYDLMCGDPYENLTQNSAMAVGGSRRGDHIYQSNWDMLAHDAGLGAANLRRRIRSTMERAIGVLPQAEETTRAMVPESSFVGLISAFIRRRGATMIANLAHKDAAAARA